MNILFIHEVNWLGKVVFDIHSLAESLSVRGHDVYAIDYENTWHRDNRSDLGSLKTREFTSISRALKGSSVCLRRPGFIKIPGISRLSVAVTGYFEIRRIIAEKQIDAVMLYSVPTTGLQTIALARKYGIPVLFRSIDVLNQLVPVPMLRPITKMLEKRVYSEVDMILSLTPGLTKYVTNLGADEGKVRLLLMPVDTDIFNTSVSTDKVREKWKFAADDKIVLFMGTLFDFSGLDHYIPRFKQITEKIPTAKLLIVGDGPQRSKLEDLISRLDLGKKVIITGFEPYEMMPQYINLASVCINTFNINDTTRDIFPGKTVQFLACGKPLVATTLPGMVAVIAGESEGIVYANSPDDMIAKTISTLDAPEESAQIGRAGLAYVKRVHSYDNIASQLEERIEEAIKNKHR
ncbi:glycosyltransferase [Chloroflexota bacterium]